MKKPATLIRPIKQRSKSAFTNNMFGDLENDSKLTEVQRQNYQSYDFVGPLQFRKKLLTKYPHHLKIQQKQINDEQTHNRFNQTTKTKNIMNNTIGKDTMISNLNKEQQIQITKHKRNLSRFQDYKQSWEKNSQYIKNSLQKKSPILMDSSIKKLYVHPNQDKTDVINTFIVHYWEMSLRNNNPILQRHIKGNTFDKLEKQKLMQFRSGLKKIQDSIPILPLDRLHNTTNRDISLNGRNKIKKQAEYSQQAYNTPRYSVSNSIRVAQQQVFKIDYQGDKKWMGSENL